MASRPQSSGPDDDVMTPGSSSSEPRTLRAFLATSHEGLSLELVAAALAGYAASASHELADRLADIDADDTRETTWRGGVEPDPVVRVPAPRLPHWQM